MPTSLHPFPDLDCVHWLDMPEDEEPDTAPDSLESTAPTASDTEEVSS